MTDVKAFQERVLSRIEGRPHTWARLHGIGRGIVDNVTHGRFVDAKNLVDLSRALGVSVDWLLTGQENEGMFATEEERQVLALWRRADQQTREMALRILAPTIFSVVGEKERSKIKKKVE